MNSLELFVFLQKNMTSMKKVELKAVILECQMEELSAEDRQLIEQAIEAQLCPLLPFPCRCCRQAGKRQDGDRL